MLTGKKWLLGRKQWIAVIGGALVMGSAMWAVGTLEPESAKMFLDFAGGFGWKVIGFTTGAPALAAVGQAIATRKNGS